MQNKKKELTYFNLFLIILGIIFLGELILQIASRLGLEIPDLNYYLTLQFIIFTPLGIVAYLTTRAKISKFISALLTAFSLYLINFTSLLVYSFDDPIAYIKENRDEIIKAFTGNTLLLLPILIGFALAEIVNLLLPKFLKGRSLKQAFLEFTNGTVKKAGELTNNYKNKKSEIVKEEKEERKSEKKLKSSAEKKTKVKKSKNARKKKRGKSKKTK